MAADSKIEWCTHTFNIVWGCQRVSPACEHCYAETMAKRYGHDVWGPPSTTPRRVLSDSYWRQPLKWNADAARKGVREKVFCSSMADAFEDHPTVEQERQKLWPLIEQTPWLYWLLLTKRPENILPMTTRWTVGGDSDWPGNVWIGTTVENQEYAEKRIPLLLECPATVRFLSCEPILGPVDLSSWLDNISNLPPMGWWDGAPTTPSGWYQINEFDQPIHWVITGGESGPGKRFCDPDWMRSLRDQCKAAGVPFFMKQMDKVQPIPDDLLIREFPTLHEEDIQIVNTIGASR